MSPIGIQRCTFVMLLAALTLGCVSTRAAETAPMRTPEAALDAPLSTEIQLLSLLEVASHLSRTEGVNVCIDEPALNDAGTSSRQVGPLQISGVTLRSALQALLRPYDLSFIVKYDVILITTADRTEAEKLWRIHPVSDLLANDAGRLDYDSLIELVSTMVEPQAWDAHSGPGPIDGVWGCLIFEQTSDVHDSVGCLLDALRVLKAREPSNLESIRVGRPAELACAADLRKRLDALIDLDLEGLTLADFADLLRKQFAIPVRFDIRALNDREVDPSDIRLTMSVRQVPLRSAIALALQPFNLTTFFEFEQLWITTADAADLETRLEIYPVIGLSDADDAQFVRDADALEAQITEHILPKTWGNVGGPCCLRRYSPLRCLVVSQTDRGHVEVARFLRELRKQRKSISRAASDGAD